MDKSLVLYRAARRTQIKVKLSTVPAILHDDLQRTKLSGCGGNLGKKITRELDGEKRIIRRLWSL